MADTTNLEDVEKTPVMGLYKPEKGFFDWDIPINKNWDLLDKLGSGRLPFLCTLLSEWILTGDDATGWALQGSELDGDTYTTAWQRLSEAQERASTVSKEFYDITYTWRKDEVTGWCFVDKANYDKAKENLKNSLGFVVDYVEGAKRIILPYKEGYYKIGSSVNDFIPQSLPNITGTYQAARNVWTNPVVTGAFAPSDWIGGDGSDYGSNGGNYNIKFDASGSSPVYQDGADVNPFASTVYLYYRVGDTATSDSLVDFGNFTTELESIKARLTALEGGTE